MTCTIRRWVLTDSGNSQRRPTMLEELQERVTELEIRFSHQTQLLDELNEVLTDCNQRIDRLSKENQRLRETVSTLAPSLEESPDE
ncbi:MAG: SlyX protein [Deltaproteobacteria bacterium]|nr:MAG: SlyX protein [Deltaproteobacteria bacterium]